MVVIFLTASHQVENPLTWSERVSIMLGTSRGLAYLHSENPPVIHHDINRYIVSLCGKPCQHCIFP